MSRAYPTLSPTRRYTAAGLSTESAAALAVDPSRPEKMEQALEALVAAVGTTSG